MKAFGRLLAVSVLLVTTARFASANLIVNGGFETGSFSSWTPTSAPSNSSFGVNNALPHSGTFATYFSADTSSNVLADWDAISQTFATTPGTVYDLTFWLANTNGGAVAGDNGFYANFDTLFFGFGNAVDFSYQQFSLSSVATGTSITLRFGGRNVPGFLYLDDVSVTARGASVPDQGSTFGLLFLCLTALAGASRLRLFRLA